MVRNSNWFRRISKNNELYLVAPHGIHDLVKLIVRKSPKFPGKTEIFKKRVEQKQWLAKWPKLQLIDET